MNYYGNAAMVNEGAALRALVDRLRIIAGVRQLTRLAQHDAQRRNSSGEGGEGGLRYLPGNKS